MKRKTSLLSIVGFQQNWRDVISIFKFFWFSFTATKKKKSKPKKEYIEKKIINIIEINAGRNQESKRCRGTNLIGHVSRATATARLRHMAQRIGFFFF